MAINWNFDGKGIKANTVTPTNNGSGAGYLAAQAGLGALGLFEGLFDFTAGGIAKLTGNKELAESIIGNDLTGTLTRASTEKYNPSNGMQVAGDISNTLGQVVGQTGLALVTGGAGSIVAAGASAAGRGVTSAYQQTGALGAKEWGYGLLSGTVEGGLEAISPVAGKAAARLTGKVATKATTGLVKTAGNGIVKTMFKEGMGEFMEESISEIADPYLQKITYNPEAQTSLTAQSQRFEGKTRIADVLYAGLLGFIGGAAVSGASTSVSNTVKLKVGTKIVSNNNVDNLISNAKAFQTYGETLDLNTKTKNKAIDTLNSNLKDTYATLNNALSQYDKQKTKTGTIARMKLGEISGAVSYLSAQENVLDSISYIIKTADDKVAYLNSNSTYKKADGAPWTVEDIKNDTDGITTKLAISDVAIQMTMGDDYYNALSDERLLNSRAYDVLKWRERATPEQAKAIKDKLGIDISTATVEQIKTAIVNGANAQLQAQNATVKAQKQAQKKTVSVQKNNAVIAQQSSETAIQEKTVTENVSPKTQMATDAVTKTEATIDKNLSESTKEENSVNKALAEKEVAATKEEKIKEITHKVLKERRAQKDIGKQNNLNKPKTKVYSLADSEEIINNVLSNYMSFGDKYGEISGKSKKQAINMLWKGLNSIEPGYRAKVSLDIADYIIQNSALENTWEDNDSQWAVDTIYLLKPYLHSLDLNSLKGEIRNKYDTDKSPYLLWGKSKNAKGVAPDVVSQELETKGLSIDAINETDIFFKIDELYRNAVGILKKKAKTLLSEKLSNEERKTLRQEIAKEVLREFDISSTKEKKIASIINKVKLSLSEETKIDKNADKTTVSKTPKVISVAKAQETAQEYYPSFQHLGVEKKGNILNAIISGRQQGVDETTLKGAIDIIAHSNNLSIEFQGEESFNVVNKETGEVNSANGFHRTSGGINFAVLNASLNTEVIRETLIHEVWHNAKGHTLFNAINEQIYSLYESENKEQAQARIKQYKSFFKDMTEAEIKEELAADYFGKKLGTEKAFSEAFIAQNISFFKKCKIFLTNLASKITNKESIAYKQTKELETLFKNIIETSNTLNNDKYRLGNGYDGYRMSNNAKSAYASGEKPLGKWLLSDFKEEVKNELNIDIKSIKGSYKKFLKRSSWHHTSKFYNKTDFYSIDFNAVKSAIKDREIVGYTQEELDSINAERTARSNEFTERMSNFEKQEKKKEDLMKKELLTCEITERVSKKGTKIATFIITEKQPTLFSEDYIPIKSLAQDLKLYQDSQLQYIKRSNSDNTQYSSSNRSGDNERGGSNKQGLIKGKIQFSLKINNQELTVNGEVTDKLVALHNLSEEKLLKVIELGGFPMPSIAVTRADIAHNQFGNITVVFGRDTIDPQRNRMNKVFSKDAWTPTVPTIEYKVNRDKTYKISDVYYALLKKNKYDYDIVRPLYKYAENLDDVLQREGGESNLIKNLYNDNNMKRIYLLDKGIEMNEVVNQQEYEKWIDDLFTGVEETKGIRNRAETFTSSGNRMSFEATHYPYTVENIVKAMLDTNQRGSSGWTGISIPRLEAKLAKEFKSIDEIRDFSKELTLSNKEAIDSFNETAQKMLNEIAEDMVVRGKNGNVEYWTELDSAQEVVGDIADKGLFTVDQILNYMKKEYGNTLYKYNEAIANKILGLFEYVKNFTETDYFEAKPRRVIGLDEIKNVLLPNNTKKSFISTLERENISYTLYEEGKENARSEIIKKMDNIKFSLSTDSEGKDIIARENREKIKYSLSNLSPNSNEYIDLKEKLRQEAKTNPRPAKVLRVFGEKQSKSSRDYFLLLPFDFEERSSTLEYFNEEEQIIGRISSMRWQNYEKYLIADVDLNYFTEDIGSDANEETKINGKIPQYWSEIVNYDYTEVYASLDDMDTKNVSVYKLPNYMRNTRYSLSTDGQVVADKLTEGLTDTSGVVFKIESDIKPQIESLLVEEFTKDDEITKEVKAKLLSEKITALGTFYRNDIPIKKNVIGKGLKERINSEISNTILSTLATRKKAEIQLAPKDKLQGKDYTRALKNDKELRKRVLSDTAVGVKIAFVDTYAGVERALTRGGKTALEAQSISQNARTAYAKAQAKLGNNQIDTAKDIKKGDIKDAIVGKGLQAIFKPIKVHNTAYQEDFYTYLAENLNIDRMKQGKEVTGNLIEESKGIISNLERIHPEFKEKAQEVWGYCSNGLKMDLEAGIISDERYNELTEKYPHYVPSFRDIDEASKQLNLSAVTVSNSIAKIKSLSAKAATGSTLPILDFETSIALQTIAREKQLATNILANALYDTLGDKASNEDILSVKEIEIAKTDTEINYKQLAPKDDTVIFYRDGKLIEMKVTKYVFSAFNTLHANDERIMDNIAMKTIEKINTGFKSLVTSANPMFVVRNFSRDMQEALFYTKYGSANFIKHYAQAISEIKNNSDLWKVYQAMGGFNSSLYDFKTNNIKEINTRGFEKADEASKIKMLKQVIVSCENANMLIEQLPRFAEFCASMEAGNTAQQALLDSADITCNFGRSGNVGKILNRTFFPFLNPAIQGCSKFVRTIYGARSMKAVSNLAVKAAVLGFLPQLLSSLMYKDDDDYKNLTSFVKENYWLFKIGDKFFKLPKGRVNSFITSIYIRGEDIANGKDKKESLKGIADSFISNLTPVENFTRTIYSPISDIKNNTTWYGSAIENQSMESVEPRYRYDEKTSKIAIAIGNVLNKSPKKIHYLLDSYSGVLGDVFLPMTTEQEERNIISSNFTIDPVTQNALSSEFYSLYEDITFQKTNANRAGDTESETSAKLQLRYLNKVKSTVNDLYEDISTIQGSDLSREEKLLQTAVIRGSINQIYTTALTDIEAVQNAVLATSYMENENLRYAEVTRLVYGSERALREYNTTVYNKAKALNYIDIDWDTYYATYFTVKDMTSDLDEDGNTISGSKKAKVQEFISSLDISYNQKIMLMLSFGYSAQNTESILSYLKTQNLSEVELKELAEVCGLTLQNDEIAV